MINRLLQITIRQILLFIMLLLTIILVSVFAFAYICPPDNCGLLNCSQTEPPEDPFANECYFSMNEGNFGVCDHCQRPCDNVSGTDCCTKCWEQALVYSCKGTKPQGSPDRACMAHCQGQGTWGPDAWCATEHCTCNLIGNCKLHHWFFPKCYFCEKKDKGPSSCNNNNCPN